MKNKELIELYSTINTLGDLTGIKFVYAIAKNVNIIKPEIDALTATLKNTKEFDIYNGKRIELAKKYSKKKNGEPVTVPTGERTFDYIIEDEEKFEREVIKLKKEYKNVLEEKEKQRQDFESLLEEKAPNINFYKIKAEYLPANITIKQLLGISALMEDDNVEKIDKKNNKKSTNA